MSGWPEPNRSTPTCQRPKTWFPARPFRRTMSGRTPIQMPFWSSSGPPKWRRQWLQPRLAQISSRSPSPRCRLPAYHRRRRASTKCREGTPHRRPRPGTGAIRPRPGSPGRRKWPRRLLVVRGRRRISPSRITLCRRSRRRSPRGTRLRGSKMSQSLLTTLSQSRMRSQNARLDVVQDARLAAARAAGAKIRRMRRSGRRGANCSRRRSRTSVAHP
mmetsp:Transcript_15907/g.37802  ORF Transcript_15907/g.37802 Transcript_15907/m.37802 type:complete len:216 (-) Transcript_15907:3890-4537(-)